MMELTSERRLITCVLAISILTHSKTLLSGFTFDDNFAVITNGDVTDDNKPLWELFKNDFWGQNLASEQSHKSYRPLTVLSLRLQRILGNKSLPDLHRRWQATASGHDNSNGLNPLPFHIANILVHALATYLVYRLAKRLIATRDTSTRIQASQQLWLASLAALQHERAKQGQGGGRSLRAEPEAASDRHFALGVLRQRRKPWPAPAQHQQGTETAMSLPARDARWLAAAGGRCEAALAALLFGCHPIHTEAVAGVVGHAELLAAVLALLGLLLYMLAADQRYGGFLGAAERWQARDEQWDVVALLRRESLEHWLLVVAAVLCAWGAALAKEIGITIAAAMVLYDVFLVPMGPPPKEPPRFRLPAWLGTSRRELRLAAGGWAAATWRLLGSRKAWRVAALAAAVLLYVYLRSLLAGDHLVRIYRKVENPIPWAEPALARVLSTGYLHAKYFSLLLAPLQLSADWSFNCVPLVLRLSDPRNAATLALYAWLAWVALTARPWQLLPELFQWENAGGQRRGVGAAASAAVKGGLPLPRSGAAKLRGALEPAHSGSKSVVEGATASLGTGADSVAVDGSAPAPTEEDPRSASSGSGSWREGSTASDDGGRQRRRRWRAVVVAGLLVAPFFPASNVLFYVGTFIGERLLLFPSVGFCLLLAELAARLAGVSAAPPHKPSFARRAGTAALVGALVAAYCVRTWLRNEDWLDEERLFVAAQKVCPESAKVRLNSGILERRHAHWAVALRHFEAARRIEPGYCEPTYWVGLTLINQGTNFTGGVQELKDAISCKYVMVEAVRALQQVYQAMMEAQPGSSRALEEWVAILLRPELGRVEEACASLEQMAMHRALQPHRAGKRNLTAITGLLSPCLESTPPSAPEAAREHAEVLRCVRGRIPLLRALAQHGTGSAQAKKAVRAYLGAMADQCRQQRGASVESPKASPGHMALIHQVQKADPEDPWLQREWGEVMAAEGRSQEASVHLQVAGILLMQRMNEAAEQLVKGAADAPPLASIQDLGEAASSSLQHAVEAGAADPCSLEYSRCELHATLARLWSQHAPANVAAAIAREAAQREGDAAQQCLIDVLSQPCGVDLATKLRQAQN